VKTLQDRPRLLPVHTTTLHFLVARHAPHALPSTRLPFERHVFQVTAAATEIRPEDDGDLHVLLRDSRFHMIAETPSPAASPMRSSCAECICEPHDEPYASAAAAG